MFQYVSDSLVVRCCGPLGEGTEAKAAVTQNAGSLEGGDRGHGMEGRQGMKTRRDQEDGMLDEFTVIRPTYPSLKALLMHISQR